MKNIIDTIENLSPVKILQSIVKKTSDLIQHDVVICNRDGIIIAAAQKNRIGIFSAEVRDMIENKKDFLIIETTDDLSFRAGINLPIKYNQKTIGSVGITGEPEDIKIYCKLIQAFIEQQILYGKKERDKEDKKHLINNFVYSWIFKNAPQKDSSFEIRGVSLGIDINLPYVVCVMESQTFDMNIQYFIEQYINKNSNQHILTMLGNEIILLLQTEDTSHALKTINELKQQLSLNFGLNNAAGIGCVSHNANEVKISYNAAKLAFSASKNTADKSALLFSHNMEFLTSSINSSLKQTIYDYTFRNYKSDKQIEETIQILYNYITQNRSIKRVACNLFMHENTIQNKLNKVYELTGYNPRNTADLTMLHSVVIMHKEGIRKSQEFKTTDFI